MGYTQQDRNNAYESDKGFKIYQTVKGLKSHPNWEQKSPIEGESKTAYILRYIAHLISPPQIPGESVELECVDIKDAVLSLEQEIEDNWNRFHGE